MKIYKRPCIENETELSDSVEVEVLNKNFTIEQPQMRAKDLYNPNEQTRIRVEGTHNLSLARRPRTDLGKTSGENPSDGLVRPAQELVKLVIETSSKMCKPKTYNKLVNNSINRNK